MKIIVDITPVLINRTAVYHMAWDIVDYFCEHFDAYVAVFDKLYSSNEIKNIKRSFSPDFIARAQTALSHLIQLANEGRFSPPRSFLGLEKHCVIYLDPLYCLLDRSIDNAVILVLDMTPLTHPSWHDGYVCGAYRSAYKKIQESRGTIISISHSTARDLWVNLGIPRKSIRVAHLYQRSIQDPEDQGLQVLSGSEKIFLFVGSLEERKNISGLIRGFHLSGLHEKGFRLVVVGGDAKGSERIRQDAASVQGVDLLGFVSDQELSQLYRTAWAFVYPSMWEGFGLPLLEAMGRGIPCIASSHSAMVEVGEGAAVFVDGDSDSNIAKAMLDLAKMDASERAELKELSLVHAKFFTFSRFISVLENAVEEIVGRSDEVQAFMSTWEPSSSSIFTFPWIEEIPQNLSNVPESHSEAYLLLILQLARIRAEREIVNLSGMGDSDGARQRILDDFSVFESLCENRIRELRRMQKYVGDSPDPI